MEVSVAIGCRNAIYMVRTIVDKIEGGNTVNQCKKQSLYTSVIDSLIENSKNWNCEFSCRAHRHNAEVLRN